MWVLSRNSGFLPKSKRQAVSGIISIGDSKLAVHVGANGCLSARRLYSLDRLQPLCDLRLDKQLRK